MSIRDKAFAWARQGKLDLAMAGWTAAILAGDTDPALLHNLRQAEKRLEQRAKVSFLADGEDEPIGRTLLNLQTTLNDHSDLAQAISDLQDDWLRSPERNLYAWTLEQIRLTSGPQEKVLVLAAIGEYLERGIEASPDRGPAPGTLLASGNSVQALRK